MSSLPGKVPIKIVISHLFLTAKKFQDLFENRFCYGRGWEPWAPEKTWRTGSIKVGAPAKRVLLINSCLLEPTCISSGESSVLKPQFWVQWCLISTLKFAIGGVFISLTLTNITKQDLVLLPGEKVTRIPLVLQQETEDRKNNIRMLT